MQNTYETIAWELHFIDGKYGIYIYIAQFISEATYNEKFFEVLKTKTCQIRFHSP